MKPKKNHPIYLDYACKVIDKWIAHKRLFRRIPGISIGVVYGDKVVYQNGYGVQSLTTRVATTKNTGYRIASISKMFTATAIMQLVEKNIVRLDDSVGQYIPEFTQNKKNGVVTLRQLLSHTSGIDRDGDTAHWVNDTFPSWETVRKHLQQGTFVYAPVERFKYSNLGYTLLGEVVHIASGVPYEQYVTDHIITPLGLTHTYPDYHDRLDCTLATGHRRDIPGQKREEYTHVSTLAMASATGFISTVEDLCVFLSAQFLGSQKLLTDMSKREMQRVQWMRKNNQEDYGLGYQLWHMNGRQIIGHSGGFPGFLTQISMDREEKIGIVVLTNTNGVPTYGLTDSMFHIINYFKDTHNNYQDAPKKIPAHSYEGRFTSRWGDMEIVAINGHILGFEPDMDKPLDEPYRFRHERGDVFTIIDGNEYKNIGETARFEFTPTGKVHTLFVGPNPAEVSEIGDF